jgi:hypothetical protein
MIAMRRNNDGSYLALQANVICVLLFLLSVTLMVQHTAWFR